MSAEEGGGLSALSCVSVRVGHADLAIPVEAVAQAMPIGADSTRLPRHAGTICCVIQFRRAPVPVVDLARWVDVGKGEGIDLHKRRALVLQSGTRTVAIAVDQIHGMVKISPSSIQRICHDDGKDEIFHSVGACGDSGTQQAILDVDRLMDLSAAWSANAGPSDGEARADSIGLQDRLRAADANPARRQLAIAMAHDLRIGIDATDIGEVVTMPAIERLGTSSGVGLCRWRGRHIPVIDPGDIFSATRRAAPPRLLAVIARDGMALGLAIHEARHLQWVEVPQNSTPLLTGQHAALLGVATDEDGATVHVLNSPALMAMYPETGISRIEGRAEERDDRGAQRNDCAYIVFHAGQPLAAPISVLEEVLPATGEIAFHDTRAGRIGTMPWRGGTIEVADLRRQEGSDADRTRGQVMVARNGDKAVALIVDSIRALVPPNTASLMQVSLAGAAPFDMITTGRGAEQVSYRVRRIAELWPQHSDSAR